GLGSAAGIGTAHGPAGDGGLAARCQLRRGARRRPRRPARGRAPGLAEVVVTGRAAAPGRRGQGGAAREVVAPRRPCPATRASRAMPKLRVNGAELYYEDTGPGANPVVFAHGLLWSGRMFDAQVAALRGRHRCVTFDFRGQGQSDVTATGYDMETLTEDAAALIETLGIGPCHFVGL